MESRVRNRRRTDDVIAPAPAPAPSDRLQTSPYILLTVNSKQDGEMEVHIITFKSYYTLILKRKLG